MARGSALDARDRTMTPAACARLIVDTVPTVMRTLRREMRGHADIGSISQYRALTFLRSHPGAALGEVAEHLGVTDATASVLVQRLVESGLVRREDRVRERRSVTLHLTDAGGGVLQRAQAAARARVAASLAPLTEEELRTLAESMALLTRIFEQQRDADAER